MGVERLTAYQDYDPDLWADMEMRPTLEDLATEWAASKADEHGGYLLDRPEIVGDLHASSGVTWRAKAMMPEGFKVEDHV